MVKTSSHVFIPLWSPLSTMDQTTSTISTIFTMFKLLYYCSWWINYFITIFKILHLLLTHFIGKLRISVNKILWNEPFEPFFLFLVILWFTHFLSWQWIDSSQIERTKSLKLLSPSPPLLPGAVQGLPLSPHVASLMPCPRNLVKVSPLPRKTGLKGGVPFSPLDIIFQFVPVPLPFITNNFFPGSPETIDSFFHQLLHNGQK